MFLVVLVLHFFPGHSHISPQDAPMASPISLQTQLGRDGARKAIEYIGSYEAIFHNSGILFLVFSIDFSLTVMGRLQGVQQPN